MTAEEFLRSKANDSAFQAMLVAQNLRNADVDHRLNVAEGGLVKELSQVGIKIQSVWDLVKRRTPYRAAIPVLLRNIHKPYPSIVLEGIGRALAVPESFQYREQILDEYRRATDGRSELDEDFPLGDLKWSLALAVSVIYSPDFERLVELLTDRSLGNSRLAFVSTLLRTRDARAWEVLDSLSSEPDLKIEIDRVRQQRIKSEKRRLRRDSQQ